MDGPTDGGTGFRTSADESRRAAEAAFGEPSGPPRQRRRLRIPGRAVVGLVLVGVAVAGVFGIVAAVNKVKDVVHTVTGVPTPSIPAVPSAPGRRSNPESPAHIGSPFTRAGFGRAVARARRLAGPGVRVQTVRLDPDQASFIAFGRGRTRVLVVAADGSTRSIVSSGSPPPGSVRLFAFSRLRPSAPARMLGTIARRYHVRRGRIDYLVAASSPLRPGDLLWLAFVQGGGRHFQADARGGSVQAF